MLVLLHSQLWGLFFFLLCTKSIKALPYTNCHTQYSQVVSSQEHGQTAIARRPDKQEPIA